MPTRRLTERPGAGLASGAADLLADPVDLLAESTSGEVARRDAAHERHRRPSTELAARLSVVLRSLG